MKSVILVLIVCTVCALLGASEAASKSRGMRQHMQTMQRRMWQPPRAMRRSSEVEEPQAFEADQLAAVEAEHAEDPSVEDAEATADLDHTNDDAVVAEAAQPEADLPNVPAFQPHTFFPMHFGHTNGASVAVANSFSTGKGNAYSHAIAHGSAKRE